MNIKATLMITVATKIKAMFLSTLIPININHLKLRPVQSTWNAADMERQGSAEAIAILILTNVKYQIHVVTRLVFVAILMVPMSKLSQILK